MRLGDDVAEQVPEHLQGRAAALEVAAAVRVATMTATHRLFAAGRAVDDHPRLLALVGTGAVSMVGLRKVIRATDVLPAELRRLVDAQLAADVVRSRWTPGQLAQAAERRVLAADPQAAARRAAAARQHRGVALCDPFDGVAEVSATLRTEEAFAVFTRLGRTARGMRHAGDPRSVQSLMADLFVESILGVAMVVPDPASTSAASAPAASAPAGSTATGGTAQGADQTVADPAGADPTGGGTFGQRHGLRWRGLRGPGGVVAVARRARAVAVVRPTTTGARARPGPGRPRVGPAVHRPATARPHRGRRRGPRRRRHRRRVVPLGAAWVLAVIATPAEMEGC